MDFNKNNYKVNKENNNSDELEKGIF